MTNLHGFLAAIYILFHQFFMRELMIFYECRISECLHFAVSIIQTCIDVIASSYILIIQTSLLLYTPFRSIDGAYWFFFCLFHINRYNQ